MRQYRGLTKDGKWVYGWYFYSSTSEIHQIHLLDDSSLPITVEVLPETVGQQVGLKDKKRTKEFPEGQEIYQGDIVKLDTPKSEFHKTRNKEIIFNQIFAQFCVEPCTSISHWPSVEIIGNIHEHPELLEKP